MNATVHRMLVLALTFASAAVVQAAEKSATPVEPAQAGRAPLKERPVGDQQIIFTVADALGFVRWPPPRQTTDTLDRLQWLGSGTVVEGGKTYRISRYSYALSLRSNGAREDLQRIAPDGVRDRVVRAYLGDKAWDESAPGVGATAVDASQARARRLQFLRTPFGFTKALLKADAAAIRISDPGAGGVVKIVLTVEGASVTALLDPYYRPSSISARDNGHLVEALFGRYRDINEYGVMFPTRVSEKHDGQLRLSVAIDEGLVSSYLILQPPAAARANAASSP